MSRKWCHIALVTVVAAVVALAAAASTTSAGTRASSAREASANGVQQIGNMIVTLKINKFVRRGKSLFAQGTAVSHFAPTPANPAGVAPAGRLRLGRLHRRLPAGQEPEPVADDEQRRGQVPEGGPGHEPRRAGDHPA